MQTHTSLTAWLTLLFAPGLGAVRIKGLLTQYPSPEEALKDNIKSLKLLGLSEKTIDALKNPNASLIETHLRWAEHPSHHIIPLHDPRYPKQLIEIYAPPPLLFIKGNPSRLSSPQIAIVGSRNPSPAGLETAYTFAHQLAAAGLVVTSGLALGVDAASHRGALAAQSATLAVLGSGIQCIYPKQHEPLAKNITEKGGLISEFPLQTHPHPHHFPQRNRIISGLSLGTLVIEAKLRSGSLITARLANEQGRDVFAIPGSIHHPLAEGCHQLLRDGAILTESTQDILNILQYSATPTSPLKTPPSPKQNPTRPRLDPTQTKLLECVDFRATNMDLIIQRSNLNTSEVMAKLLILQLHGYISPVPGGYQRVE